MKIIAILRIKDQMLTIDACLGKLSDLVDDIIVLDNGSTDGTMEAYARYPKVTKILRTEGFNEGRDKIMLLDEAKKSGADWIMWIDGDEIFEKHFSRAAVDRYMRSRHNRVVFRMCNFWLSKERFRYDSEYYLYTLHPQRSMWRNIESANFKDQKIHNGDIRGVPGKAHISPYRIKHYGHVDREKMRIKMETYLAADPTDTLRQYRKAMDPDQPYKSLRFREYDNVAVNKLYILAYKYICNALWLILRVYLKLKKLVLRHATPMSSNHSVKPLCHICSTPAVFMMKKDDFDEYLCPACGLSFVFPQPSAEWLKNNIYSYDSGYQGNKKSDLSKSSMATRNLEALDFLAKEKPCGEFMDIGCSNGALMYHARKRGFSPSGIEINKRTADMAAANGFPVHQGFLETCPFPKGSFDVIYLGDVIEHVNSPRDFVKDCESFLKEGGLMAISTPNVDCPWSHMTLALFRAFGMPWSSATPPHHLFQFSYENLNRLMEEHDFHPIRSIYTGPTNLHYHLGSLHLLKAWKAHKTPRTLLRMAFSFAAYSFIFVISRIIRPFHKKNYEMVVIYKRS